MKKKDQYILGRLLLYRKSVRLLSHGVLPFGRHSCIFFNFLLHYRVCFWVGSMFGKLKMKICKPHHADEDSNCLLLHAHANPAHLQKQIKESISCPPVRGTYFPSLCTHLLAAQLRRSFCASRFLTLLGRNSHVSAVCLQKLWRRE